MTSSRTRTRGRCGSPPVRSAQSRPASEATSPSSRVSAATVAETDDLRECNRLVEALRDTALFATPPFRLDRVLVGIEEGFRDVTGRDD
jgi:hypothetical protein